MCSRQEKNERTVERAALEEDSLKTPMHVTLRWLALTCAAVIFAVSATASTPVALKTTEFGSGPTIVLVPGMGAGRMSWMPTARLMLGRWHVVMVDLPGHGESPLPDPFSLENAAEAVDQVVAAHSADSTVIVGQGVGGLLALMSASAHPTHQRGLVLIDVALKSPLTIADQQRKMFDDFMDQNYDAFFNMVFGKMGRDSAQSVAIRALAAQTPPNTIKSYMRSLLNVDANHALRDLKTPMMLIATDHFLPADKDWPTVGKQMGWEDAASVQPRRLANCGVLVATELPDSLTRILSDFANNAIAKKKEPGAKVAADVHD
jgi:pimeloyl-ACP methyl ester carboxylesterase